MKMILSEAIDNLPERYKILLLAIIIVIISVGIGYWIKRKFGR